LSNKLKFPELLKYPLNAGYLGLFADIQGTVHAFVPRATDGCLKDKTIMLTWRPVNLAFVTHLEFPPLADNNFSDFIISDTVLSFSVFGSYLSILTFLIVILPQIKTHLTRTQIFAQNPPN
jgi:hypothetical protein